MNLLEKQLSAVYFKDVRFLCVTLHIAAHWQFVHKHIKLLILNNSSLKMLHELPEDVFM